MAIPVRVLAYRGRESSCRLAKTVTAGLLAGPSPTTTFPGTGTRSVLPLIGRPGSENHDPSWGRMTSVRHRSDVWHPSLCNVGVTTSTPWRGGLAGSAYRTGAAYPPEPDAGRIR